MAGHLRPVLPHVKHRDISMIAEIVLLLQESIQTRDVDWLAWEDPFVYRRDPERLKAEREQSLAETHKRLAYVIPMLELLHRASQKCRKEVPR
jgi:hypothetical protein